MTNEERRAADCEQEIAALLADLSDAQESLLAVLKRKRECMANSDLSRLAEIESQEAELLGRLEACQQRRQQLLSGAGAGAVRNLEELSASLADGKDSSLSRQVKAVSSRMRIVQNHALTNWVIAQRSLLHLSQLLAIMAAGGRPAPTYGAQAAVHSRGALVDQEA